MTRKEIMLFVIPAALLVVPFLLRGQARDLLDRKMDEAVGTDAVDCGRVLISGDRDTADACAVAAFKARKPFRLRYDTQKEKASNYVGGYVASGVVGTPQGRVFFMHYTCAYWRGFRYNEKVSYNNRQVIVKQRNGKEVLGFASK